MDKKELQKLITPNKVNIGVVQSGIKVPFLIENNSPLDFQYYTKSCDCVADVKLLPRTIEGTVEADYKETGQVLFVIDGHYCLKTQDGRYFNIETNGWVSNPGNISEPIVASNYGQSIQVYFNDGKPANVVTENGQLVPSEQTKLTVSLTGWILK